MSKGITESKEAIAATPTTANDEYAYLKFGLSEPLKFQGQEVAELDLLKLKDLTLNEMNDIYDTYAAFGGAGMVMQEATLRFAQLAAAAVSGYPIEMIG